MTSLGSLCKEKILAAANELSVDTEIIKVQKARFYPFYELHTQFKGVRCQRLLICKL